MFIQILLYFVCIFMFPFWEPWDQLLLENT